MELYLWMVHGQHQLIIKVFCTMIIISNGLAVVDIDNDVAMGIGIHCKIREENNFNDLFRWLN